MLDIRPMPAQLDAERLSAMRRAGVSTFGHQRLWGICAPAITPLFACAPVAGTAVTLALPGPDSVLLHDTIELLRAGDILVIDRLGDERHACVGGIVARAAKLRGVAALVVDGPVTDAVELADIGLPIWCRGLSGQTTRRLALGGRRNCPVAVGGAVVEAGDAILCDRDGVMAISPDQLDEALAFADKHMKRENFLVEGLALGKSLAPLLAASGVVVSSHAADRASDVPPAAC